mmetsp:Transcript_14312/g.34806  ORF Transcript_14312/g.34806 Transcript_14312/m.34806 type:complete len:357 (+) Transcript_14312:1594-2664(+)
MNSARSASGIFPASTSRNTLSKTTRPLASVQPPTAQMTLNTKMESMVAAIASSFPTPPYDESLTRGLAAEVPPLSSPPPLPSSPAVFVVAPEASPSDSTLAPMPVTSASRPLKSRMRDTARLDSDTGDISATRFLMIRRAGGRSQSKSPVMRASVPKPNDWSRVDNQLVNRGFQPSWCGSKYTMPQRDTVAGEATAKSATSKIMFIAPDIAIISELGKHSFLLSSSTVFMFSIQMASTGPSSTSHFRLGPVCCASLRNCTASTPSFHSCVALSVSPYSCPMVTDLGLRYTTSTLFSSFRFFSCNSMSAPLSTLIAAVFPEKDNPTTMSPCRTTIISYSWMHFSKKYGCGCRLSFAH